MFAARTNQENAIHEQQTAAAFKNQSLKGLAPKTPGNQPPKTPFKAKRNNENLPDLTVGKQPAKDGKPDWNAFVTPAGPRTRAPLGIKTTNAKALQTPGPATYGKPGSAKPTSPRLRRSKIKVHEATPVAADNILLDSDEDDIEFMPPREVPMPDFPDDLWPHDREYPQYEGQNLTRGWYAEYRFRDHDSENDGELSDLDESWNKVEANRRKQPSVDRSAPTKPARPNSSASLKSQHAARALATRSTVQPASAPAQPHLRRGGPPSTSVASKKPTLPVANSRFTAAKVASNSTIGYSKGRTVSALARRPLSQLRADSKQDGHASISPPTPVKSTALDDLLKLGGLDVSGEEEDDDIVSALGHRHGSTNDHDDDEWKAFQLPVSEDA